MSRRSLEEMMTPEPNSGCWLWLGALSPDGYGCVTRDGHKRAHRWSYEHFVGPIPRGLTIDHKCRVRCCINPAHLEPVPHAVNVRRTPPFLNNNARKTHCKNGHLLSGDNLVIEKRNGRRARKCRACKNAALRRCRIKQVEELYGVTIEIVRK